MLEGEIQRLLEPYVFAETRVPATLYSQLAQYLELLLKWSGRTNLTSIREPEEIVRRHFGESLFAAQHLGGCEALLDFGSGAGFPGLPIQLLRPDVRVTLAESQNKKATFLREAIRTLGLRTEVWAARVEAMPATLLFDVVTLRAVDNMKAALEAASVRAGGQIMLLTTVRQAPLGLPNFVLDQQNPFPGSNEQQLLIFNREQLRTEL